MKYNKVKRTFSVLSAVLGLIIALASIFAVVMGIMDVIGKKPFSVGESLEAFGLKFNYTQSAIQWIILIVALIIAVLTVLLSFVLMKKPMEINEKFKSNWFKKIIFAIFVIVLGAVIALQLFAKEIADKNMMKTYIVVIVAAVVALLQIISIFIKSIKKEKEEKVEEAPVEEAPVVEEEKAEVVPVEENKVVLNQPIAIDPVADGFEQRVREIKHLREAGLINDEQMKLAIENIISVFIK